MSKIKLDKIGRSGKTKQLIDLRLASDLLEKCHKLKLSYNALSIKMNNYPTPAMINWYLNGKYAIPQHIVEKIKKIINEEYNRQLSQLKAMAETIG